MTRPTSIRSLRLGVAVPAMLALALALGGCGRDAAAGATTSTAVVDDQPAAGTVTLWAPDGDATVLDKVLTDFKKANPDLDLKITLVPSDQYTTKLQTAVSSGTLPDIAQLYMEDQAQFLSTGAFMPVPDGLVDDSTFFPAAWESGSYNGTKYSVPWYTYTRVLIYRKDLAAAGKATVPTTWAQMVPFFKALQAGGATSGFGADVGWDTYTGQDVAIYAHQAGATLLNDDSTAWAFDNAKVVSAIRQTTIPFTEGVSSVDTPQFLDVQPYFVQGKIGSLISGPWVVASLDTTAKKQGWTAEHVATAVLPQGPDNGSGELGGGSWVVNKKSKNASSAWKVIRHMADKNTQIAQFKAYGTMPAVEDAWKDPSIADNPLYDPFFEQLKNIQAMPAVPTWGQMSAAIGKELEAVARGKETPEQAAKNLQSQGDRIGVGK